MRIYKALNMVVQFLNLKEWAFGPIFEINLTFSPKYRFSKTESKKSWPLRELSRKQSDARTDCRIHRQTDILIIVPPVQ